MLWLFDINETLLDLQPVDAALERSLGRPGLRAPWFDRLIHSALVLTAVGQYRDFGQLGGLAAEALAADLGADWDEDDLAGLKQAMGSLQAHPDVVDGLTSLRDRGDRLVAFGNSNAATVERQLLGSGLAEVVQGYYSAEQAGALKPSPQAYAAALSAQHTAAEDAVMVAAHDWDIAGAMAAGLRGVFVSRDGRRPLGAAAAPTHEISDLRDLAGLPLTPSRDTSGA